MKIAVVAAPGLGDALILQIVTYQLFLQGYDPFLFSPHRFGSFFPHTKYGREDLSSFDAIFLQHDNSEKSRQIHALNKPVYTFYGSHRPEKHGPLRKGFDYVCDLNLAMVENIVLCLQKLFHIKATDDNGFFPLDGLVHRKRKKQVAIHATSGDPQRNWPLKKFQKVAEWLEKKGYQPVFLPEFSNLEQLTAFLYESDFFIGNDSGPGHLASCLRIPHLIIGRDEKHMRHWRPGWLKGEAVTPSRWFPRKIRKKYWKMLITKNKLIKTLHNKVLHN